MTRYLAFAVVVLLASCAQAYAASPPLYPDQAMTPGVVDPSVTTAMICAKGGYTNIAGVRHVTAATKRKVLQEYGYTADWGSTEVDHRLPLILGGSNDIHNLWAESYLTAELNAHRKDHAEVATWHAVCEGKITLPEAQALFLGDWVDAYTRFVGPLPTN